LADKLTQLMLDALGRAALAPAGTPLVGAKGSGGLFPSTGPARQAAQRACDERLIRLVAADPKGKPDRDLYAATETGLAFLMQHTNPKQVLEDLARAVEARQGQVAELLAVSRETQAELVAMKALLSQVSPQLAGPSPSIWLADLQAHLGDWTAAGDCPLPDLYRRLRAVHPALTIGQFHDGLRELHDRELVYLHPWTGPLYELPEPAYALLIGHEVAYYASERMGAAVVEYQTNGVLA
jgi:hypothetical protein